MNLSIEMLGSSPKAALILIPLKCEVWSFMRAFRGQTVKAIEAPACIPALRESKTLGNNQYMILLL